MSGSEDRLSRNKNVSKSSSKVGSKIGSKDRSKVGSKDRLSRDGAGSNQSVEKLPLIGEQKAYYLSMRELPYHQLDSHTSVTNNQLGSNESGDLEKEEGERWEPTLVLHDPSRTQLGSLSEREDSLEPPVQSADP